MGLAILIIVILIIAFATNPSISDFERFIKKQVENELNISSNEESFITRLFDYIVGYGVQVLTYHQDFKFFSIFNVELPSNESYQFLGVFTSNSGLWRMVSKAGILYFFKDLPIFLP